MYPTFQSSSSQRRALPFSCCHSVVQAEEGGPPPSFSIILPHRVDEILIVPLPKHLFVLPYWWCPPPFFSNFGIGPHMHPPNLFYFYLCVPPNSKVSLLPFHFTILPFLLGSDLESRLTHSVLHLENTGKIVFLFFHEDDWRVYSLLH